MQVGKVAASATRDENFLPGTFRMVEQRNTLSTSPGLDGTK
jgi:hypothetical protein